MAALDFPAGPSDGQTYTPSGSTITYTYTTAKGSWQGSLSGSQFVPTFATLTATNTTNSTHYPLFAEVATGNEELRTDTGLFYNPSTGLLTTTGITAALTGTFGVVLGSDAEGDTYYRNSSGNFVRLARGSDNHVMTMSGNVPNWEAAASGSALDDITLGDAASILATSAGNITIDAQGDDTDIIFKGTDGSVDTTFLTLDGSAAGAATFNSTITATELTVVQDSAATNAVTDVMKISSTSSGTPAANIGVGIEFETDTADGPLIGGRMELVATNVLTDAEDYSFKWYTTVNGGSGGSGAPDLKMTLNEHGGLTLTGLAAWFSGHGVTLTTSQGVRRSSNTGTNNISGGTQSYFGGNVEVYGYSHATQAKDIELRSDANVKLHWDDSGALWDFQGTDVLNIGALAPLNLIESGVDSLTAGATQTQAGATALTRTVHRITTVAADGDGVALPAAIGGESITIINADAAQSIKVWPVNSGNDEIDGGAANAVDANQILSGEARTYVALSATSWSTKSNTQVGAAGGGATSLDGLSDVKAFGANFTDSIKIGDVTTGTLSSADESVYIGVGAGNTITSAINNVAIGWGAAASTTAGQNQVAIGWKALNENTGSTYNNVAIGKEAGMKSTSNGTVFIGNRAGWKMGGGTGNNVYIGNSCAYATGGSGIDNTCVGAYSAYAMNDGDNNTFLGKGAGGSVTDGCENVMLGEAAGSENNGVAVTTGDFNILIGFESAASSATALHQIVLGSTGDVGKGDSTAFIEPNGGGVYAGNNSADFSTTSDRRIKKNIFDNDIGLEKINKIQVRNFEYRTPDEIDELPKASAIGVEGVQLGVIAQEVMDFLPDIVKEETTGCLTVDGDNIKWYLVNAVKQLSAELEELKRWKEDHEKDHKWFKNQAVN